MVGEATFDQTPTPDSKQGIPFAIESDLYRFAPEYYPKRFNEVSKNELSRQTRQCGGEDVYIKNTKNSDFHANGIVLAGNVPILRKLINGEDEVDLISPIVESGGVECVIKKGEIGDIVGWDRFEEQWQFEYTLDLVSTGADSNGSDNQIVSQLIEKADGLSNL